MDSIRSSCTKLLKTKIARLLFICVISTILVVILGGAAVAKYAIIIDDQDLKTIVYTSENQPETILQQQNIVLSQYDTITFSGIEDNKGTIKINRAREIKITADGNQKVVYMTDGTVDSALQKALVKIDDDDLINVSLDEPIKADMDITINRVVYKTITVDSEIPCEILKFPTQTLKKGITRVLTQGENGINQIVSEQTLIDGKVIEEKLISDRVTKSPKSTRLLVGDPNAPVSQLIPATPINLDANGNPVDYKYKVTGKATAYSALGKRTSLKPGNVAMNLSKFPRGTKVYIKTPNGSFTYGYSQVKDTGPAVRDGRILVDLFFSTYKESCLFGAKIVDIYIL